MYTPQKTSTSLSANLSNPRDRDFSALFLYVYTTKKHPQVYLLIFQIRVTETFLCFFYVYKTKESNVAKKDYFIAFATLTPSMAEDIIPPA